jgi:CheY-like chemotaxis protein
MSEDPVSVAMLIASQRPTERELWHQAISLATVPVALTTADTALTARAALAHGGIDIVVVEAAFSEPDRTAICRAARTASSRPVIVVSAAADSEALGLDADSVVTTPSSAAEAGRLMDRMVRVRLPSRALIVDDSGTMRSIVRKILQASKFPLQTAEAAEGATALRQLRESEFDIIFLDYNMPGLNGLETLAAIRREHPRLQVVVISSTQDEAIAAGVLAGGAAAFLRKPFFPSDIDAVLHAYCGMRPMPGR